MINAKYNHQDSLIVELQEDDPSRFMNHGKSGMCDPDLSGMPAPPSSGTTLLPHINNGLGAGVVSEVLQHVDEECYIAKNKTESG